ncbi:hypothetical protein LXA43DRAFT_995724 [Ganoderma leucocontextum]|nr:hypothetical protein LXA43DRAFT_995724 [Ganoderma leucocontextum]
MDTWPGYCEQRTTTGPEKKGKGKAEEKRVEDTWRYPDLDHGTLGAASLKRARQKTTQRYSWTFAAEDVSELRLVPPEGPLEVFPPTRPKPLHISNVTSLRRAEQGAHFLRQYYPDVDISGELIRESITEDERVSKDSKRSDVFAGNMVDASSFQVARKDHAYLAFPMGERCCQLNMSPLIVHSKTKIELKPMTTPVYTFDTPIQQILASPRTNDVGKGKIGPVLGVRTMGSASFMQVKVARTTQAVELAPLMTVKRSDIGDRQAIDMSIYPSNTAVGYVANEAGDIFQCRASESKTVIEKVHTANASAMLLCRIAAHETREKVAASFDATATVLDLRAGKKPYELFTVTKPGVALTSIEAPNEDHTLRLVSTDQILWLDERYTRKPLLAVKHSREFDLTLRTQTHVLTNGFLTFLTSRKNSLVTVYDVSRDTENLVHMHGPPYALPSIVRPDGPHLGFAFYQQPTLVGTKHISLFQLSERGSVSLLNLDHVSADMASREISTTVPRRAHWTPEVQALGEAADAKHVDQGPLAGRAHGVVNMQLAYHRLFMEQKEKRLVAQANTVNDVLERMPRFWQDPGAPVEHPLTTFDIALRMGDEPPDVSRNDWATGSSLDCFAGYRALEKGRIPRERLVRSAPWHLDASPSIRRHVLEFDVEPKKTIENLTRYDLAADPRRAADSYRRETEASSQLALDLSLAADVFSMTRPRGETPTTLEDDMLSISLSAQAMTLGDLEPPPVQFGFLRPVRKVVQSNGIKDPDGETGSGDENEGTSKLNTPRGVRLLLQEWEVGSNPHEYVYRDPYDDSPPTPTAAPRRPAKMPATGEPPARVPTQIPTQRPPPVASSIPHAPPVIAASQPTLPTRRPLVAARSEGALVPQPPAPPMAGSQPTDVRPAPPSSQDVPFASTQVLPGPYGGRAISVKNKPGKKRVGGF